MEECWDLMNQIERLIKDGYLKRYIVGRGRQDFARQGGRGQGRGQDSHPREKGGGIDPGEEIRGTVAMIAEGFI
ncbi:hypothetical protein SESBI_11731 [Sesbania bispinosa]|nr:hypothetical protein SESBI_11731 [Sesbania bispinosa]